MCMFFICKRKICSTMTGCLFSIPTPIRNLVGVVKTFLKFSPVSKIFDYPIPTHT